MRLFWGGVLTRVVIEFLGPRCGKSVGIKGNKAVRHYGTKNVKIKQLLSDFTCPDFITNLVPYCPSALVPQKLAFTMAEILISLTIIGVIAAITLPALQANINEKTWTAQRKALYSRMSQAISMMPSLNGYGVVMGENGIDETSTANRATQAFISEGLSKVLKINNICPALSGTDYVSDRKEFKKCGFPEKIVKMGINSKIDTPATITDLNYYFSANGTNVIYSQIRTKNAAFETVNGESILVTYNPNCSYTYGLNKKDNQQNHMQPTMCVNFIYDLNGTKGPNQVGKDIGFMTAFYPTDSVIAAPYPLGYSRVTDDGSHPQFSIGYGNLKCRKNFGDDAKMANIEELKSLFVNNKLGYTGSAAYENLFLLADGYISSSIIDSYAYCLEAYTGKIYIRIPDYNDAGYRRTFCVKK